MVYLHKVEDGCRCDVRFHGVEGDHFGIQGTCRRCVHSACVLHDHHLHLSSRKFPLARLV